MARRHSEFFTITGGTAQRARNITGDLTITGGTAQRAGRSVPTGIIVGSKVRVPDGPGLGVGTVEEVNYVLRTPNALVAWPSLDEGRPCLMRCTFRIDELRWVRA